jgi:hypothetical protein
MAQESVVAGSALGSATRSSVSHRYASASTVQDPCCVRERNTTRGCPLSMSSRCGAVQLIGWASMARLRHAEG